MLRFGEGSLKGVAAGIVWLALLYVFENNEYDFRDPQVVLLVSSLLRITTIYSSAEAQLSAEESSVARVIKQNQQSKTQAVSSLQWAAMLKALSSSTEQYDKILSLYENHPEVMAAQCPADDSKKSSGVGSLALGGRMKVAVRNWLYKTDARAWARIVSSTHDLPFALGPFGEHFAANLRCFLSSISPMENEPTTDIDQPLEGEPFITLDYKLILTPDGQYLLFQRICNDFDHMTAMLPIDRKKSFRCAGQDLSKLVDLIALWDQVKAHLVTRLGQAAVTDWESKLAAGSSADADLLYILNNRPAKFALSFLPTKKQEAANQHEEKEQMVCMEVETSRVEVRNAKFGYLKKSLESDIHTLSQCAKVPELIEKKMHRKEVLHLQSQSTVGQNAVKGYMEKHATIKYVGKADLVLAEVVNKRAEMAARSCDDVSGGG